MILAVLLLVNIVWAQEAPLYKQNYKIKLSNNHTGLMQYKFFGKTWDDDIISEICIQNDNDTLYYRVDTNIFVYTVDNIELENFNDIGYKCPNYLECKKNFYTSLGSSSIFNTKQRRYIDPKKTYYKDMIKLLKDGLRLQLDNNVSNNTIDDVIKDLSVNEYDQISIPMSPFKDIAILAYNERLRMLVNILTE